MAYCEECGAKLSEGVRFCEECGTAVSIPNNSLVQDDKDATSWGSQLSSKSFFDLFDDFGWTQKWREAASLAGDCELGLIITRESELL